MPQLKFNRPFNEKALAASVNRRQQLDHLLRVTAPRERLVLAVIGASLTGVLLWILFGSLVRDVSLDGVLIHPGSRHAVMASEPGYLTEYLVAPGDRVEPGAPIARQTVPELARETALLRERLALLESDGEPGGADGGAGSLLASARVALLGMEAQRSARELIVSAPGGEVSTLRAAPGDYLPPGTVVAQLREPDDRPHQATLRVAPQVAQRLRPGMRASVEVQLGDGESRRLEGVVREVAAGPLPAWLATMPPAVSTAARRVDIDLDLGTDLTVPDGTPCRVRIVLGRYRPISVLGQH